MKGRSLLPVILALPLLGAADPLSVNIAVTGLRSDKGMIQICLFHSSSGFPDCSEQQDAIKRSIPAQGDTTTTIDGLSPGVYAISLIHDENGNGRLDTRLGIPREGVGFSRNPNFFFGPPGFKAAQFDATEQVTQETVRVRYFL